MVLARPGRRLECGPARDGSAWRHRDCAFGSGTSTAPQQLTDVQSRKPRRSRCRVAAQVRTGSCRGSKNRTATEAATCTCARARDSQARVADA